jgi:hypothetical protein
MSETLQPYRLVEPELLLYFDLLPNEEPGVAHRVNRLRHLQRLLERAQERGNDYLVLAILEQAAKPEWEKRCAA